MAGPCPLARRRFRPAEATRETVIDVGVVARTRCVPVHHEFGSPSLDGLEEHVHGPVWPLAPREPDVHEPRRFVRKSLSPWEERVGVAPRLPACWRHRARSA